MVGTSGKGMMFGPARGENPREHRGDQEHEITLLAESNLANSEKIAREFLEILSQQGGTSREAALLLGTHENTISLWKKHGPKGPALLFLKLLVLLERDPRTTIGLLADSEGSPRPLADVIAGLLQAAV